MDLALISTSYFKNMLKKIKVDQHTQRYLTRR